MKTVTRIVLTVLLVIALLGYLIPFFFEGIGGWWVLGLIIAALVGLVALWLPWQRRARA